MKLESFDITAERIIKFNDILIDLSLDVPNTQVLNCVAIYY